MDFREHEIIQVRKELERRRGVLVGFAKNVNAKMDEIDRCEIIQYLDHLQLPIRPETAPELMKMFVKSCFSYSILRKFCVASLGEIPTLNTIDECLARIFNLDSFRLVDTWFPGNLKNVAEAIQKKHQFDLDSNEPRPRMVRVMIDGSTEMAKRLKTGLPAFYQPLDKVTKQDPELMWEYVLEFSKNIYNVGPALICDFLKEIGYSQFVKVDHHFKKQFPALIHNGSSCRKLSPRKQFIQSLSLAKKLEMTPFHLDKILYIWGKYGMGDSNGMA